MIRNHIKIAWRSLVKNRFFTILNLGGLALGIAVSLALILFVNDEISFDKYHENIENIYRIGIDVAWDDTEEKWAQVPNIAGPTFKDGITEIKEQARFLRHSFGKSAFLRINEENYIEKDFYWADNSLFDIFDLPLIEGDPKSALLQPNQIIISQSAAEKIFGTENPIGETVQVDNNRELLITGIFKDFPSNSTLDAQMIGSFNSLAWAADNLYWSNCSFETYILTHLNADQEKIETSMNRILDESVEKSNQWFSFWIQPLNEVHLFSEGITDTGYSARMGDIGRVRLLGFLALSVLLLACFNYINMTTARSQQRFREVGINKTLGASSGQMIRRFFVETGILVAFALVIGMLLVRLGLPYFEQLTGRPMSFLDLSSFKWPAVLFGLWGIITIGAGIYPALFLSSVSPKRLLQPALTGLGGQRFFRQALVILQFVVCIALIGGALVLNQQLNFISNKKLGFQPEQVIAVNIFAAEADNQVQGLINAYRNQSFVKTVCKAQGFPGIEVSGYSMSKAIDDPVTSSVSSNKVTPGFEEVLELEFLAGKTLPEKSPEDTTVQVVMNKTGAKFLGFTPEEAIGKTPPNLYGGTETTIVGVVEDFHFESLHNPISAYVFNNGNDQGWTPFLLIRLNSSELTNSLPRVEEIFSQHLPKSAFEFTFLDDHTQRLYENEKRLSKVVWIFTLLTILISCLGLFGLAAYTAERRTKEIGIRKVLGASVGGLIGLLAKEFMKPVLIAVLIATPLAFFGMNKWLLNFAYSININWTTLALAGILACLIAFITVAVQSFKAAQSNPINSLRNE